MSPMQCILFITATIVNSLLTTSSSNDIPYTYTNCTNTYSCGNISNISYPFFGGDRPDHCGLPAFKLTCQNNTYTELALNSATFRVLNINQSESTLTLGRQAFYNTSTTCQSKFLNTTLNSTLFTINDRDDMLTLIYGCSSTSMSLKLHNQFTCGMRNESFDKGYYVMGPVPGDPLRFMNCSISMTVPMLREVGYRLMRNRMSLQEALMEGFSVNYIDPYEIMCKECNEYGGQCGFDSNLGVPLCVCGGRPCPLALAPQPPDEFRNVSNVFEGSKKNYKPLGVGLGIAGVAIAVVAVGWSIFVCRKRRKRVTTQAALSTEPVSKDIITTSSSKPLISSASTTFSKSIPSYTSPEPDLLQASSYFGVQIFNYTELEKATDYFSSDRELGDGGFGAVYHGILPDGREVAVKRLYENNFKRLEQFMTEIRILGELRHPNLVHLYGCTSKRSQGLLLVYEYIPNGTVADHLHGKLAKPGLLPWSVRLKIAVETADALAYLHRSDVIHRDVKTNNILLDNDFHVKVGDFGLSRLFPNDVTHVSTAPQGTPGYVDPEYYQVYQLTGKSDVYSFGVVLIELISSLQAVDTNRHRQDINLANMAVNKIQNHAVHELVDQGLGFETNSSVRRMASLVAELAFRCLQQERDMRPSMQEVLEALKGIENEELKARKEEVVEIVVDDAALIKGSDPSTPDSTDKSVRASAPHSV